MHRASDVDVDVVSDDDDDDDDNLNQSVMTGGVRAAGSKASIDAHTSDPCTMLLRLLFVNLCICVFVYLCIYVFVSYNHQIRALCHCVFVFVPLSPHPSKTL